MKLIIDIPNSLYANLKQIVNGSNANKRILDCVKTGTLLNITNDGTLEITVNDYSKVNRVLVQDENNNGGLFYADSN